MDRPGPDPAKLLANWMEWERGETMPGRVMSNMKTGGLRDLLEKLAAEQPVALAVDAGAEEPIGADAAAVWTPVV